MAYTGSIDLISGLRPKNNGTFPLINAPDVLADEVSGLRLDEALTAKADRSETDEHFKAVSYNSTSGTMTFTRESGETEQVTPSGGTIGFEYSQLANYTFQDVKDAVDAGKTPYILYYGSIRAYLCEWVRTSGDAYICSFTGIDPSGTSGSIYRFNGNRALGNAMTDSLGLLVFSSVPIASASGVELTESNGALVNSDIRMNEVSAKENFFVNSGGASYQKEYTWYTTIYYKNLFIGYAGEMIIKNESNGALYKHTGLGATLNFQPYTP